ncbi:MULTISPECIES: hypothetical protein [Streptomyces rochei group]|uniref:hypothetical protein n=1 Tax=Streptomyces rochei group TaxID=2867164 RepID=UPI0018774CFD|nr:hypothetical protein [Streptomyces vinaceusdrappus]GHC36736.1 hypothetical protein GCM10010308_64000 [Streptomyces vinaceusdrappus]
MPLETLEDGYNRWRERALEAELEIKRLEAQVEELRDLLAASSGPSAGKQQRVKHSGPDTQFCVLCLSGEHERVEETR